MISGSVGHKRKSLVLVVGLALQLMHMAVSRLTTPLFCSEDDALLSDSDDEEDCPEFTADLDEAIETIYPDLDAIAHGDTSKSERVLEGPVKK